MKNLNTKRPIYFLICFYLSLNICLGQTPGSYDINFDGDGKKFIDFNTADEEVFSVRTQSNGKIIAAINVKNSVSNQIFITRYFPDGSTDNSFGLGGGGLQILTSGDVSLYGNDMELADDGSIFIAGWRDVSENIAEQFVYKLTNDGELDQSFGNNGQSIFFQTTDNSFSAARDIAITNDDKILVSGEVSRDGSIVRLLSNGELDNSFSFDGKLTLDPDNEDYVGIKIIQLEDDKILCLFQDWQGCLNFNVVRFLNNGEIDNSFGEGGISSIDIAGEPSCAFGSADRPENMLVFEDKIYIIGSTIKEPFNNTDGAIVRLNSDGSLDDNFSFDGKVLVDIDSTEFLKEIIISSDFSFYIVGTSCREFAFNPFACVNSRLNFIKYNDDGTLATDFGNNGIITELFTARPINVLTSSLQNDSRLLFAGQNDNNSQSEVLDGFIFRINTDITTSTKNVFLQDHCKTSIYPTLITGTQSNINVTLDCDKPIYIQNITLIDVHGRTMTSMIPKDMSNFQTAFQLPIMPVGLYLIRIQTSKGSVTEKLLKIE